MCQNVKRSILKNMYKAEFLTTFTFWRTLNIKEIRRKSQVVEGGMCGRDQFTNRNKICNNSSYSLHNEYNCFYDHCYKINNLSFVNKNFFISGHCNKYFTWLSYEIISMKSFM